MFTVYRQAPDVRAGGRMSGGSRRAGCPGWTWLASVAFCEEGPDFRAKGLDVWGFGRSQMSGVMARCPGCAGPLWCSLDGRCRIFRGRAGCPGWAGCPVVVVAGPSSFSFLHFRACLALVLGLSMVSSGVLEYAQGPRLSSTHVLHAEREDSERSEFTLGPKVYA